MRDFFRSFLISFCLLFLSAATFAQTTYDWTGAVSTEWSNAANWESTTSGVTTNPAATYPGSADQARIGVLPMTNTSNWPVISAGGASSVGSIVWGTENYLNVYLTVNTTFTVNGSINNTSSVPLNGNGAAYTFNISGTGILNVTGDLNIGYDDGFSSASATGNNNSFTFNSSLNQLSIQGSTYLNSVQGGTHHRGFNPALNITSGTVTTSSIQSTLSNSTTYNSTLSSSVSVGNSSGTPTATLKLTGASALPSFSPYIVNTVTFNNPGATVEYSGASQTVYTDYAVANLSNTISYYSIKFSGTGLKTALSGNLNVAGDFTNTMANDACNCNSVSLSAPIVNFNGTTQNLYGGGGNGTTFYTVNCSNSGTKTMQSGVFKLASTGVLTMSGSSTQLSSGSGIFTLLSDASSTATVAAIPLGCSITGSVNVQRYISGTRGWRFLSSPVNNGTTDASGNTVCSVKYLQSSIYISGATGIAGGFDWAGNPSLFLYREDNTPNSGTFSNTNFRAVNGLLTDPSYPVLYESGSFSIPQANGYQVFIRGDRNTPGTSITAQQSLTYTFPSVTLTASGTLNQGQIRFKSWYTPSSLYLSYQNINPNLKGFNLVGNPYPSSIDWDTFNTTSSTSGIYGSGVSNYIYSYNFTNKLYAVYQSGTGGVGTNGGSHIIGSGQGFFAVANAASPTLIFNESAKTNSSYTGVTTLMSKGTIAASTLQLIRLRMALDSINTDETMILFNSSAKSVFDPIEDAPYKIGGGRVRLNSLSQDSVAIAINHVPLVNGQPVRLNIGASASGTYSLNLRDLRGIPQMYNVWLKDTFVGDSVNLRKTNAYSFTINKSNTATFGDKRFSIIVKQDPAYAYKLLTFIAARLGNSSNVEIRWQTANEGNYTNFTVERSTDGGKTFAVVGGMWGNGSGDYGLMDKNVQTGTIFYRLKSQDINNAISYSDLGRVVITNKGNNNLDVLRVYPNPATNVVNLEVLDKKDNATYNIIVSNSTGFIVKQATSSQANWQTSVSDLLPGTYLVRVVNSKTQDFVGESKFIKL